MSYGMGSPVVSGAGRTGDKIPKGYKAGQIQQFTPEQMDLFKQMFSQLGPDSFLGKLAGGDQSGFDQMEAPALKQFSALQGNIASRFSGMGGLGARKSSGFQNSMNQASSDFAQQLQSQRMGYQQQAMRDLHSMSSDLLGQRPYDQFVTRKPEKQSSGWGGAGGALLGGAGGFFMGGPAGVLPGAKFGYEVGSGF